MANQASDNNDLIEVEVAYAKPAEQTVVKLQIPLGSTTEQAVNLSGILQRFPEINGYALKVGILGAVCKPDHILKQGDRVEIYRPLIHDPKDARRQRALKK
jgi:uncharacterized protein